MRIPSNFSGGPAIASSSANRFDYLILGGGVLGLSIARALCLARPGKSICVLEKEPEVAMHASGRNSGVLHAGFYYTANSLKAKFTREGCAEMKEYCRSRGLPINECKKVVVARSEQELAGIYELEKRGKANQVAVQVIDEKELADFDPNARTFQRALYSPSTATVNPVQICLSLKEELQAAGVRFHFNTPYRYRNPDGTVRAGERDFQGEMVVNAAGLYADKIAKDFSFSRKFRILPFKGIYLKYTKPDRPVRTNIYPVPNLKNPFLGVHFTITVDGQIKIGPTAIPAFWRENYSGWQGFRAGEMLSILRDEAKLFATNAFRFRSLAFEEMQKYNREKFVSLAEGMVHRIDKTGFTEWSKPGIRAQLLNTETLELVQDYVVEGDCRSVHVLNAVSPAFTCSLPFGRWIVSEFVAKGNA